MMTTSVRVLAACVLMCAAGVPGAAAQTEGPLATARYEPGLRFRTLTAGRVDIYFHQREEEMARRLARIVQVVAPQVDRELGAPRDRVRVVLVDQTDLSNGWATVFPYNLIEIAAVPPTGESQIGNTDDWLRLVFTHEYTHVLHLEKSRGWFGGLRRIFGRVPLFYPNLFVPDWQIEGLATFEETAFTGRGRVAAGDFRMILDHAAAAGRFAPLDRATTAVIDWPGGSSAYLYGAFFHQFLAERYGPASLRTLAEETAGRLPYTGSRAFEKVYGKSLGELWREFEMDARSKAPSRTGDDARRAQLTRHGFEVSSPAFTADGRLLYSVANPHHFPAVLEHRTEGRPRHVTSRVQGRRLSASGQTLVFDQVEVAGATSLFSDVWHTDLSTGKTRRLTEGARAADPDVSPDGATIVCTVQETGRRVLATFTIPSAGQAAVPVPLVAEAGTEFGWPRWSPDGRSIVAERRQLERPSELVVVDVATRQVRVLFSTPVGRAVTPMWLRDGKSVLFAWDAHGGAFRLHAVDIDSGVVRQLSGAGDGAHAPALSPDGSRLVFVGYSAEGYDLYAVPFDAPQWTAGVAAEPAATQAPAPIPADADVPGETRPYSPFDTIAPRFWIPYFERDGDDTVVGAATGSTDALGRHTYAVTAGWALPRNRADIQAEYSYTRWRPAFFAGVSDDTDTLRDGYIRSRDVAAGMLVPFQRVRWTSNVLASVSYSTDDLLGPDDERVLATRKRTAGRAGWNFSNAKTFGYSISAERGTAISLVSEFASGSSATARTLVAEARGYLPVMPRHAVLAGRVAGAFSRGDERVRREFGAGGNGPQGGGFGLGVDAIGLLRGFDDGAVFGRSALVMNGDYRFPLGWPQRGYGTLPVFVRALHGAVFFDAAHAWDAEFSVEDMRRSVGGELSLDTVVGGALPLTIAGGVAWRHDPSGARRGSAAFLRIGRAF